MMEVPFVDLYAQYLTIQREVDEAIALTIRESSYIGGKSVAMFEEEFAAWIGVEHAVACANGTDSIEMILHAAGVGPGDEVIVPAVSWISTSEAVSAVGARPVFVDVDADFLIDIPQIETAITPRTKAIIPVHLYGNPVDMHALMAVAEKHGLFVLEDCAQAHGASVRGRVAGTFGHAASYSFYPGKNLGAYGDAGAVLTNDRVLAERVRMIANHGQKGKHNHLIEGRNSRMDGLQAAILRAKLPHLHKWTAMRKAHAAYYSAHLGNTGVITPHVREDFGHVFHLYVIQSDLRDDLMAALSSRHIHTAIHYPAPLPALPCYAGHGYSAEAFPNASRTSRILSLPMYAELTRAQMDHVIAAVREFQHQAV
jgi:dTDP-4-amino-4,6-dideoxygalactose transaminase